MTKQGQLQKVVTLKGFDFLQPQTQLPLKEVRLSILYYFQYFLWSRFLNYFFSAESQKEYKMEYHMMFDRSVHFIIFRPRLTIFSNINTFSLVSTFKFLLVFLKYIMPPFYLSSPILQGSTGAYASQQATVNTINHTFLTHICFCSAWVTAVL